MCKDFKKIFDDFSTELDDTQLRIHIGEDRTR